MFLPTAPGEAWKVTQGVDDPTISHMGAAAFCWDLMRIGTQSHTASSHDLVWPPHPTIIKQIIIGDYH